MTEIVNKDWLNSGQRKYEDAPFSGCAFNINPAVVSLDNILHHCQSKAGPPRFFTLGQVRAETPFEYIGQALLGDAYPLVTNLDYHLLSAFDRGNADIPSVR